MPNLMQSVWRSTCALSKQMDLSRPMCHYQRLHKLHNFKMQIPTVCLSGWYWSSLGSRFVAHLSRILYFPFSTIFQLIIFLLLSHISSAQLKRTGSDSINQSMHDICNLIFIQRQKFWVSFFSAAIVVQNWKSTCACRFLQRNQFMEGFFCLIMQACVRKIHPNF